MGAKGGVTHSLKPDQIYLGQPAMPIDHARRCYVVFSRLPTMAKDLKALRREVEGLRTSADDEAQA